MKRKRKPLKKKITTTKLLILFLFINCSIIEIFTMYVTFRQFSLIENVGGVLDFSPLVTLIGSVVGEVIGFAIYAIKSAKENTYGGIVYDTIMKEQENKEGSCG